MRAVPTADKAQWWGNRSAAPRTGNVRMCLKNYKA